MFPFLKQIVWYSGTIFSVSVNTTVFIAAISDSEQLGNSVYANEAELQMGLGTELWFTWYGKNNARNNRSIFLFPADDTTRVLLQGNEDYINASYVNVS